MSLMNSLGTSLTIKGDDGFNFGALATTAVIAAVHDRRYNTVLGDSWLIHPTQKGEQVAQVLSGAGFTTMVNFLKPKRFEGDLYAVVDMTTSEKESKCNCIANVEQRNGMLIVSLIAGSPEDAKKALAFFKEQFKKWTPPRVETEPKSHVNFWMMGPHGPTSNTRLLDVTTWPSIKTNYPTNVGNALEQLVNHKADKSGQIVMLHGDPGVGKTWLLRALAWEWQPWCTMHYIMDAGELLNGSPAYMTQLLFAQGGPDGRNILRNALMEDEDEGEGENGEEKSDEELLKQALDTEQKTKALFGSERWRLIILEDTGELLTMDAAARTGGGLGRLLNAADGMLGQGSRVLFLITTNEPLEKIHPAVARPGRALANIHFDRFPRKEAQEWVEKNGGDPKKVDKDLSLAEMYAVVGGKPGVTQVVAEADKKSLGFKAGANLAGMVK
jgi:hypothetical protein